MQDVAGSSQYHSTSGSDVGRWWREIGSLEKECWTSINNVTCIGVWTNLVETESISWAISGSLRNNWKSYQDVAHLVYATLNFCDNPPTPGTHRLRMHDFWHNNVQVKDLNCSRSLREPFHSESVYINIYCNNRKYADQYNQSASMMNIFSKRKYKKKSNYYITSFRTLWLEGLGIPWPPFHDIDSLGCLDAKSRCDQCH